MTPKVYQRLPTTIEAIRWTGSNFDEIKQWCGDHVKIEDSVLKLFVKANIRWLPLVNGEWIAKDRIGFYPIQDDIFLESYTEVK